MYIVVRETHRRKKKMATKDDLIRQALIIAEDNGLAYNGGFGAHNVPCTYWVVGDYIVTYMTDDEDFDASMLTEDMIDDLIIDEVM